MGYVSDTGQSMPSGPCCSEGRWVGTHPCKGRRVERCGEECGKMWAWEGVWKDVGMGKSVGRCGHGEECGKMWAWEGVWEKYGCDECAKELHTSLQAYM